MKLSVRTNILILFLLVTGIVATVLISSQYYFSKKTANDTTQKTFQIIAGNIEQKTENIKKRMQRIMLANRANPDFYKQITFNIDHPVLDNLIYLMNLDESILSLYFTNEDKALYKLININNLLQLPKDITIPKEAQWAIIIYKEHTIEYAFLNKKQEIIQKFQKKETLHINSMPWYTAAITADGLTYTGPYKFKKRDQLGFTYAMKLKDKKSVFAINYTLDRLNRLLQTQKLLKESQIFLFDKNGKILASSDTKEKELDPVFADYVKKDKQKEILRYNYNNNYYYAIYKKINKKLYLGIRLDADVLFAPYKKNLFYSLLLALLFILLSIPLILYTTKIIVKPIYALIQENEKIKNRNFQDVQHIETNIIEFNELSDSLVLMAQSIEKYQKEQKRLLDSIIQLIAEAVDAKSSYTAGHCRRVPEIANMLLDAAANSEEEHFKEFQIKGSSLRDTFSMAAWLHDCGKVTTPEYVVDKATKLETIYNRIHEIRTRFEVLWRDTQIAYLNSLLEGEKKETAAKRMDMQQKELLEEFAFIAQTNIGNESLSNENIQKIKTIAEKKWLRHFDDSLGLSQEELKRYSKKNQEASKYENLLADKQEHLIAREFFDYEKYQKEGFKEDVPKYLYNHGEIYNLSIQRGTLTPEERYKINEHAIMSIKMLEKIPFPQELTKVPEYAGQHHERLDGKGYPRKLTEKELSLPSRIMAIADIFEALTAADRPYKKAKTLSQALDIMHNMAKERHIDKTLFELFVKEKIYITYAKKYLKKEQIDEINEEKYLS